MAETSAPLTRHLDRLSPEPPETPVTSADLLRLLGDLGHIQEQQAATLTTLEHRLRALTLAVAQLHDHVTTLQAQDALLAPYPRRWDVWIIGFVLGAVVGVFWFMIR